MPASSILINPQELLSRAGVRAGQHVADLGCGTTGHVIIPAARAVGSDGRAYAVDVQKAALAATEGKAKLAGIAHLETVWADLERAGATAIPAGTLDATFVVNTLHLVRDRTAVLREAARLTKSGGSVVAVDWGAAASPLGPPPASRVAPDAVRVAAKDAGLVEREQFVAGPYHYGLVFMKP